MVVETGRPHRHRRYGVPGEKDWAEGRVQVPHLNCNIHGSGQDGARMVGATGVVLDRALLQEPPNSGHIDVLGLHWSQGSGSGQSAGVPVVLGSLGSQLGERGRQERVLDQVPDRRRRVTRCLT